MEQWEGLPGWMVGSSSPEISQNRTDQHFSETAQIQMILTAVQTERWTKWSLEIHSILFFFIFFSFLCYPWEVQNYFVPQLHSSETEVSGAKLNKSMKMTRIELGCLKLVNHLGFANHAIYHLCLLYHQKQIFANHSVEKIRYCCHNWMLLNAFKAL